MKYTEKFIPILISGGTLSSKQGVEHPLLLSNLFDLFLPVCFILNGETLASNAINTLVRLNDKGELLEHRMHESILNKFYTLLHCVMYRESLLSLPSAQGI